MMTKKMSAVVGVSMIVAAAGLAQGQSFSNTLGQPGFTGSYVASFAAWDDGTGEALYATGSFTVPNVTGTQNLAKWNGSGWESVGGGLIDQYSNSITVFQGDLIAGGYFNSAGGVADTEKLARFDGTQWNSMDAQSASFLNSIWDLVVWDDGVTGEQLYIAGNYLDLNGQAALDHIAKWDGTTYTGVGGTIAGAVPLIVLDLQVADLGDGEKLYAGGRFLNIGGVPANNIAVWDGTAWAPLGGGLTQSSGFAQVLTMTVFDDGSGPALFVGGTFQTAGSTPAVRIAKWDGSTWSAVGDGFDSTVNRLVTFDDGSGEALYALGRFNNSGSTPTAKMAKWNGTSWEQLGDGADGNLFGGFVYDAGQGTALHIGGGFSNAGGLPSNRVVSYVADGGACNAADLAEPLGELTFADITAFLAAYNGQDAAADLAEPFGSFTFADITAFLTAFNAGCP
jgi:hypothetical protein